MSLFKSLLITAAAATSVLASSGEMTYFYQGGISACGKTFSDSDAVVALSANVFGGEANPNNAAVCGKWIKITGTNGKTARAQVWDKCPGNECDNGSIDVSPGVFQQIAELGAGRVQVTWEYEEGTGGGSPTTSEAPVPTSEVVVPTTTSEVVVPTTTSEVVVPTTTSEVVVPTTTSEVVVPSTTSEVAVPSTTSTSIAAPTTFSTRVRPTTTTQAAPTTTSLPGQVLKESDKVKVVVVTEMVTVTVLAGPGSTVTQRPTSS